MKNIFFQIIIISLAILLVSCEVAIEKKNSHPPELIEFLKIEKNKDNIFKISDLFFAKSYNTKFRPDKDIKISHNTATNEIKLDPVGNFSGLRLIHFANNGIEMILPVIVKQKEAVEIKLTPPKSTKRVWIMGSFNTWNRRSLELKDKDGDGTFTRTLYLDDGVYEYQFVTEDGEFPDPVNPVKVDNGYGSYNSLIKVKSKLKGQLPNIYALKTVEENKLKYVIDSEMEEDIKVHILINNNILDRKFYEVKNDVITINTSQFIEDANIQTYRLIATYKNYPGNIITTWTRKGKLLSSNEFIWQDATIYSLMTDRFSNGNTKNDNPVVHPELGDQANFQGGDFDGLINKIQSMYFQKIGVNTIWISPVNATTNDAFQEFPEPNRYYTGYHGYWPAEPRKVEPRLGTMEDLQKLINVAHQHDIKILIDYVSNHTHQEHPYFQEHRDWYGQLELEDGRRNIRLFDEYRLTTWFDDFLPSFDFESEEAANQITEDALWWINQTNADGFRHDATKHVPLHLWRNITRRVNEEIEPNKSLPCYQIGETFGSAELIKSYVNNGMLDSQFNFELFFTQRRIFAEEGSDLRDLQMSLDKSLEVYGFNHLMGNIFDSHDQTRMMALLEDDLTLSDDAFEAAWNEEKIQVDKQSTYEKQKAIFTMLFTVPGVPIVYYGDEFGMTGAHDPDNRRMMRFGNELTSAEQNQLNWNSKIFNLREKHSALRRGDYLPLYCDEDVMIYSRGDQDERIIIAINKSEKTKIININFPDWMKINLEDVLTKKSKFENGQFILDGYSGSIWKCE